MGGRARHTEIPACAGILGAYGLNNWNEARKETQREIKFYKEMISDLEENRIEIGTIVDGLTLNLTDLNRIHDYLTTNQAEDDSLKIHFEGINVIGIFNSPNSAYQNMQNSGACELNNDSLRLKITKIYEQDSFNIHFRNNKHWQMLEKDINPFMRRHFKQTDSESQGFVLMNQAIDYQEMRKNIEFQNLYLDLKNWVKLRLININKTQLRLDILIEEIHAEIDRLSN